MIESERPPALKRVSFHGVHAPTITMACTLTKDAPKAPMWAFEEGILHRTGKSGGVVVFWGVVLHCLRAALPSSPEMRAALVDVLAEGMPPVSSIDPRTVGIHDAAQFLDVKAEELVQRDGASPSASFVSQELKRAAEELRRGNIQPAGHGVLPGAAIAGGHQGHAPDDILHVYTNGADHVVAANPEEASEIRGAAEGLTPWEDRCVGPMTWKRVRASEIIDVDGQGGGPSGRLRADQWARALGRGVLCSEDWVA